MADEETVDGVPIHQVRTAFLVLVTAEGRAWATGDMNTAYQTTGGEATLPDIWRACSEVMKDVTTIEAAERTAGLLMQIQAQATEQRKQAALLEQLRPGLRLPGG